MASEIKRRFTDTEMQIAKRNGSAGTADPFRLSGTADRQIPYHSGNGQPADQGPPHLVPVLAEYRRGCHHLPPAVLRQEPFRRRWSTYWPSTAGPETPPLKAAPKPISGTRSKGPLPCRPRNADDRRVFAYLRKRGIAAQVIRQFLNAGLLYEDAVHHNCVFVGRDESGQAKYAGLRGTYDLNGPGFKRRRSQQRQKHRILPPARSALRSGACL